MKINKIIPLLYILFGAITILVASTLALVTIVGDSTYASNSTLNVTEQTGHAHLNVSTASPYDSLVLHYNFDYNDSARQVFDLSGRGYNGVADASVRLQWPDAVYGFSGAFNQSGGAVGIQNISDNPANWNQTAFTKEQNVTIMAWVKGKRQTATNSGYIFVRGLSAHHVPANPFLGNIIWSRSTTTYGLNMNNGSVSSASASAIPSDLENEEWIHIAYILSWDGISKTNITVVVNGSVFGSNPLASFTPSLNTSNNKVTIGKFPEVGRGFNGTIDEFMFFNKALTTDEVNAIYQNQSARFQERGEQVFLNLDMGGNNTANITINECQTYLGSQLKGKIKNGAEFLFDSNCEANNIGIAGETDNTNLTIIPYAGTNNFYSPLWAGNITIESWSAGTSYIDQCQTLNSVNTYVLTNNITDSGETCINVNASNIELDCAGYSILYDSVGTGKEGISIGSQINNITIKNCYIVDTNSSGTGGVGINFTRTEYSTVTNNTIATNGAGGSQGIYLGANSHNNTLLSNTITAGHTGANQGVYLGFPSHNNSILYNVIKVNGTGNSNTGLQTASSGANGGNLNIFSYNNITVGLGTITSMGNSNLGTSGRGIARVFSFNNILVHANIHASGMSESGTNDLVISNNITVIDNSGNARGIGWTGKASNISLNTIYTAALSQSTNNGAFGIILEGGSAQHNFIVNNTITSNGIGIPLSSGSHNNTISHNTINTWGGGANHYGLSLTISHNNTISHNKLFANGTAGNNHGIYLISNSVNDTILYNIISANGTLISSQGHPSYGIYIDGSSNSSWFFNNVLNETNEWIFANTNTFSNNFTNTTLVAENGSIHFKGFFQFDGVQNATRKSLNITASRILLNSTALSSLNTSAEVIFYGVSAADPNVVVDWDEDGTYDDGCNFPDCNEISFASNTYKFNVTHFTIYTLDTELPNGTLKTPTNNTFVAGGTQNFTANISDVTGIKNATLFIYNSSNSIINFTHVTGAIVGAKDAIVEVIVNMVGGVYTWFYEIFDLVGNVFYTSNFTLTVDATSPSISFISPTPNNNTIISASQQINISSSETGGASANHSVILNLDNSLVLWYRFNNESALGENDTYVADASGNNLNGTVSGGALVNISGKYGKAFKFDGTDGFIDTSDINDLDGINQLTVSAWIYPTALATNLAIVSKWDYQTQANFAFQTYNSASDELQIFIGGSLTDGGTTNGFTTNANLANNNWYHVLFVYNGTGSANADKLHVYVDGVKKTMSYSGTIPTALQNSSATLKIGKFGGTLTRYFPGHIDEITIYNRSLTAQEIQALYNAQATQYDVAHTLTSGNHSIKAYTQDLLGNTNETELRTFEVDTNAPSSVQFESQTSANNVNLSQTFIIANVSATDGIYLGTIKIDLFSPTALVQSNSSALTGKNYESFYVNFSGLGNNTYYLNATVNDSVGNINISETRIIVLDTDAPNGTLKTPTNNIIVANGTQNFTANISDEVGIKNATLFIYNSSNSIINFTHVTGAIVGAKDAIVEVIVNMVGGVYTWFYEIFDLVGNVFYTSNFTLTVDATSPSINFVSPTPGNNSALSESGSFQINASITETRLANVTYIWNGSSQGALLKGAILHYNFNNLSILGENDTFVVDASNFSNNGTVYGGALVNISGKYGKAFTFDGINGHINATISGNAVTTAFWYRNTTLDWTYIVNTSGTIYVNGIQGATQNYPITVQGTTIQIGARAGSTFFNGSIDEVVIYNRALSAREVNLSYYSNLYKYDLDKWQFWVNQTNIFTGVLYTYDITAVDAVGNSNTSSRTIASNTAPTFPSLANYTPSNPNGLDPNNTITITVNVSDLDENLNPDSVVLQWKNSSEGWTNITMNNITFVNQSGQYNTTLSFTYQDTFAYRVMANDTAGITAFSSNVSLPIFWDCNWLVSPLSLGGTAGYNENKKLGDIFINNTGDPQHANSSCSLDFRLTYNLSAGRIFIDNDDAKPSNTITVAAGNNRTVLINGSFQTTEGLQEVVAITLDEFRFRSNLSTENSTATLVTTSGGPFLFTEITSNPATVSLTPGNFSLEAYIRNLVGDDNINNTAFNVTFNWTLPSDFIVIEGVFNVSHANLSDNTKQYNDINITLNATNLPDMSPGTATVYVYGEGVNASSSPITHAGGNVLVTESKTITFSCYNVSDGITVTACGSLDGDFVSETTTTTTTTSGSSGGGGGGGGVVETATTSADYQIVRGEQNEIIVVYENKNANKSLTNLQFSLSGGIAKYIEISPISRELLAPESSMEIILKITSPTYIKTGREVVVLTIKGFRGGTPYEERKKITIEIHEISGEKAVSLVEEATLLFEQFKTENFTSAEVESLFSELKTAIETFNYEKVESTHERIKLLISSALGAKSIIAELQTLLAEAEAKGIDTSGTSRIMRLAILSLERSEFEQAFLRAKEAQVTYALEVKGEFGKLTYYLRNNPIEITIGALFLTLFGFTTYRVTRLQLIKRKIRKLKEEEEIIHGLMKIIQKETFKEGKMSMEEYNTAMEQYEKKLASSVEQLIELESLRVNALKFTPENKRLRAEKEHVIELIKKLQKDYLQLGKMETRSYDLKLDSYNRRLNQIEQQLATLEAKSAIKGVRGMFRKK